MLITEDFHFRVEELAYRHSKDWRVTRPNFTSQDNWLIAQCHVRRMGPQTGLVQPWQFVEKVRSRAFSIHNQRPHTCYGQLSDWDQAWLMMLRDGHHLQSLTSWEDRSENRLCSVVYFVQTRAHRNDLAQAIYQLQMGLQWTSFGMAPSNMLFEPYNCAESNLISAVRNSNCRHPRIFVVDAEKLQEKQRLHDVIMGLDRINVPWRCDADFISYSLSEMFRRNCCAHLDWHWANHAGWEWRDIAYTLLCDMLAI